MPAFLIVSTGIFAFTMDNESIHYFILFFAVPVSLFALNRGYKNHKTKNLFLIGITGILILLAAIMLPDSSYQEQLEKALTVLGSILVVYAHYKNYKACKEIECETCHQ
tara:strand:- start:15825 stop:16151 length:327 start_codon:yes stop_codon:yes gene_type:complete